MPQNKFAILETTEPTETPPTGAIYYWVEAEGTKKALKYKDSNGTVGYLLESNGASTKTYSIQFANGYVTRWGRSVSWCFGHQAANAGATILKDSRLVSISVKFDKNAVTSNTAYVRTYPVINGVRYINTQYEVYIRSNGTGQGQYNLQSGWLEYTNPLPLNSGDVLEVETEAYGIVSRLRGVVTYQIEER